MINSNAKLNVAVLTLPIINFPSVSIFFNICRANGCNENWSCENPIYHEIFRMNILANEVVLTFSNGISTKSSVSYRVTKIAFLNRKGNFFFYTSFLSLERWILPKKQILGLITSWLNSVGSVKYLHRLN